MEWIGDPLMYLGAGGIWLAVGYFASRLWNAGGAAGPKPTDWKWRRPVTTVKGRIWFGMGVVGGLVSLAVVVVLYVLLAVGMMASGYDPWADDSSPSRIAS